MTEPTILIIDDEPQIRRMLVITLESQGYRVREAENGKHGIAAVADSAPDLVLLDLGLPDVDGQTVLLRLREWYTRPIIIVSVHDSEESIIRALDAGATDYLTKPFRTGELLARIRSAMRNRSDSPPATILKFDDLTIDLAGYLVTRNSEPVHLTQTEFRLLVLLARFEGRVLTHHFLLREIWGVGHQEETQYLRVYIGQLRKKLEADPEQPRHILTESGIGYRFQ